MVKTYEIYLILTFNSYSSRYLRVCFKSTLLLSPTTYLTTSSSYSLSCLKIIVKNCLAWRQFGFYSKWCLFWGTHILTVSTVVKILLIDFVTVFFSFYFIYKCYVQNKVYYYKRLATFKFR